FSSRRRHTRCYRDWSSDVCSSDLGHKPGTAVVRAAYSLHNALVFPHIVFATYYGGGLRAIDITDAFSPVEVGYYFGQPVKQVRRSEERRVGKERRCGGWR